MADRPVIIIPHPHVRSEPSVMGGGPFVVGSRVPVRRIYRFFAGGASVERIIQRYPQLGAAKVLDALAFAFDNPELIAWDIAREEDTFKRAMRPAAEAIARKESP